MPPDGAVLAEEVAPTVKTVAVDGKVRMERTLRASPPSGAASPV